MAHPREAKQLHDCVESRRRDMWGAAVKKPDVERGDESRRGKGPWQSDVEKKLAEAIELGVRSSGKAETREYRVAYYTGRLAKAKVEVKYYEEMLRLEEAIESLPSRFDRDVLGMEQELERLKLRTRLRDARVRDKMQEYETATEVDPVSGWGEDPELPGEVDCEEERTRPGEDEWDTTLVKKEEVEPHVDAW
jgi:hypothetical protein